MNRCRASLRLLVLAAFALIGALPLANGQPGPAARDRLTPAEAFDDVDVLMQTLSAVHPNLHFHATPRQVAALRATAEATFVRDVTREEFYTAIEPLVRAIGEKHTRLIPPAGTADAQPTPSRPNYRWDFKLLPEGIGYLDFVSMDSVGRADWDVFLERTFARIREQHVRSLISDATGAGTRDWATIC